MRGARLSPALSPGEVACDTESDILRFFLSEEVPGSGALPRPRASSLIALRFIQVLLRFALGVFVLSIASCRSLGM